MTIEYDLGFYKVDLTKEKRVYISGGSRWLGAIGNLLFWRNVAMPPSYYYRSRFCSLRRFIWDGEDGEELQLCIKQIISALSDQDL